MVLTGFCDFAHTFNSRDSVRLSATQKSIGHPKASHCSFNNLSALVSKGLNYVKCFMKEYKQRIK